MEAQAAITSPGDLLRKLLAEREWTQEDLAVVMGRSRQSINEIISGRSGVTPETAIALAAAFGNEPSEWLRLEGEYRLALLQPDTADIEKRSKLLQVAPIKEMQKRGWLSQNKSIEELEIELEEFFADFDSQVFYKRTIKHEQLNKAEKAWITRARQLAKLLPTPKFEERRLEIVQKELRRIAAKSKATHRVPEILFDNGIRYVVVEPLTNAKIDGAAFWLNENSPVIAMSIRFDNIGSFWFTLMHEFSHIKNKDTFSLDSDIEESLTSPLDNVEMRASKEAAETLVPSDELESFIKRYAPFYSEARLNNLATRLKIHPGIIVGQLQFRKEIGYNTHRKLMVKVRDFATTTAFTDGWGHPIPQIKAGR